MAQTVITPSTIVQSWEPNQSHHTAATAIFHKAHQFYLLIALDIEDAQRTTERYRKKIAPHYVSSLHIRPKDRRKGHLRFTHFLSQNFSNQPY